MGDSCCCCLPVVAGSAAAALGKREFLLHGRRHSVSSQHSRSEEPRLQLTWKKKN